MADAEVDQNIEEHEEEEEEEEEEQDQDQDQVIENVEHEENEGQEVAEEEPVAEAAAAAAPPPEVAAPAGGTGGDGGGGEEKWPGWPGESVFRMLVPAQKVGGIIGRKGEFIKKIVEETRARIKILDGPPGTSERAEKTSLIHLFLLLWMAY